jgi:hypothetical protein
MAEWEMSCQKLEKGREGKKYVLCFFGWSSTHPFDPFALMFFFREQAAQLLVIILREKNVIQFMRKTGPKNHTHEANL